MGFMTDRAGLKTRPYEESEDRPYESAQVTLEGRVFRLR